MVDPLEAEGLILFARDLIGATAKAVDKGLAYAARWAKNLGARFFSRW